MSFAFLLRDPEACADSETVLASNYSTCVVGRGTVPSGKEEVDQAMAHALKPLPSATEAKKQDAMTGVAVGGQVRLLFMQMESLQLWPQNFSRQTREAIKNKNVHRIVNNSSIARSAKEHVETALASSKSLDLSGNGSPADARRAWREKFFTYAAKGGNLIEPFSFLPENDEIGWNSFLSRDDAQAHLSHDMRSGKENQVTAEKGNTLRDNVSALLALKLQGAGGCGAARKDGWRAVRITPKMAAPISLGAESETVAQLLSRAHNSQALLQDITCFRVRLAKEDDGNDEFDEWPICEADTMLMTSITNQDCYPKRVIELS